MIRSILITLVFLVSPFAWSNSIGIPTQQKPKISIVVDDLGDNSVIARQMVALPATLTMAILPHTPHAKKISELANQRGHEVIMHLPMEAETRPDLLGPGALFSNMAVSEFKNTFLTNAGSIPNLVGFNNHMGSLLTQDPEKMAWLMILAKQKNWYFLDSKTSEASIAENVAEKLGLPTIGRDIFLDHHTNEKGEELTNILKDRLERAKRIAQFRGKVVIICHPYPETLAFLQQVLPSLVNEFELTSVSRLLNKEKFIEFSDSSILSRKFVK
ncbi:divergent polysaccharide deacetylase family protein [Aliikangiella coralliicola]|uniref:Divergent polysaccharide deacetylase family protein n=1 Tax=Aliikangiella coralliicola TaxID=2592383 RepID=A0A545UIB8_9GAMM|nr:divergent polysaccharide deacetylase family protein [Aliikangiella coralliicola]TQV89208.1 divergent polysaccharide deacetylase family protein [Aliikangiella coralliicola]